MVNVKFTKCDTARMCEIVNNVSNGHTHTHVRIKWKQNQTEKTPKKCSIFEKSLFIWHCTLQRDTALE